MSPPSQITMAAIPDDLTTAFTQIHQNILDLYTPGASSTTSSSNSPPRVLPELSTLSNLTSTLQTTLPQTGLGLASTTTHLTSLLPGLNQNSLSPHYYGFVTGGVTPAALLADFLVSTLDQNLHVHLPSETLATVIEDHALSLLLQLFHLEPAEWKGRIFTAGATGANILGLACAREFLLQEKLKTAGFEDGVGVAELGILEACVQGRVMGFQVLSAMAHSSVTKAVSVLGLGRRNVVELGKSGKPWEFDLELLEERLKDGQEKGIVSVVVVGLGEVNTGRFDTGLRRIRELVDQYGGWIHVDAAMGIFARVFAEDDSYNEYPEMQEVASWTSAIECADSIAGDGHKLLNVPYDCGFFFTRTPTLLTATFQNTAPYLSTPPATSASTQPSPLNINLDNSRRFRAFPVYATLTAYGASGYKDLISRLISHSRSIARVIYRHPAYQLLPLEEGENEEEDVAVKRVFMIVLFRAKEEGLNKVLKERINETGRMYVSGTVWDGKPAVRVAVSNWRVGAEKEGKQGWGVVEEVLEEVVGLGS